MAGNCGVLPRGGEPVARGTTGGSSIQVAEQRSPEILFPSSHCSEKRTWRMPSPQYGSKLSQSALHIRAAVDEPYPPMLFTVPLSQTSAKSTMALPHILTCII